MSTDRLEQVIIEIARVYPALDLSTFNRPQGSRALRVFDTFLTPKLHKKVKRSCCKKNSVTNGTKRRNVYREPYFCFLWKVFPSWSGSAGTESGRQIRYARSLVAIERRSRLFVVVNGKKWEVDELDRGRFANRVLRSSGESCGLFWLNRRGDK